MAKITKLSKSIKISKIVQLKLLKSAMEVHT